MERGKRATRPGADTLRASGGDRERRAHDVVSVTKCEHPVEWLVLIEIYGVSDILQEDVVYPRDLTKPWVASMELGLVLLEQALLT
jgi:hypothetical protein